MNPDAGGPKTYGSYVSGSATLVLNGLSRLNRSTGRVVSLDRHVLVIIFKGVQRFKPPRTNIYRMNTSLRARLACAPAELLVIHTTRAFRTLYAQCAYKSTGLGLPKMI